NSAGSEPRVEPHRDRLQLTVLTRQPGRSPLPAEDCPRIVAVARRAAGSRKARLSGPFTSIGETGFEPATARPPAGCATSLRHSPWQASGRRELNPFLELGRLPCSQNTSPARATQCYRRLR